MKKIIIATLLSLTASAWAQAPANVEVKDAWVRATVAQQKATGAFMQLTAQADTRVVQASSPIAGVVEIHEMAMDKDVMKMRAVPALALPAGKTVELKPGGYHVMLMDLKGPVKAGDVVPVTLVLEGKDGQRSTLEVKATARPLGSSPAGGMTHGAHKH
ncbi:MAG: copper chaperone PCu(A)C [Hydrogenophaga sp.]|jgi:copper(I)-binding protein|uniref:copper chaperone PCu(A)C n=1 Tax=Hydrogenophaga sp. TaxID=1904254 RepID=UPI0010E6114F|nr:copper chaperone PCu(A)C [Hydrogenophaga sp.]MDO9504563.1 copper chaperone PCu(A)C [Hydrogenophaga sp.]MDP2988536.1 copper chaperone PCu(A)C [Hydrogenophaga sp.]MDP3202707.1 copper chaperone PCu(A)C [Hydrogenophaga sp.]MDP3627649.1 copper chaperone PCu(A)C [Hydrogenophaga sp.]